MAKSNSGLIFIISITFFIGMGRLYIYLDREGVNYAWTILIMAAISIVFGLIARKIFKEE